MTPNLRLLETCEKCFHYDGDHFCALPEDDKCITGYVAQPEKVVCVKWTKDETPELIVEGAPV